ncbi:hypothetical protein IV203_022020 [Nitzschia inconspicua]|uniref:Uncharacterized protein n=1 Tax=Nitzschia inconspicua TaxID=303405 RepID=A0A9K3KHR0_9STRA|nr:hypothetical protein IV203_022020 [Nitzschia inconspicua]
MLLESMFDILACGHCTAIFGKWKTKLQDDDADLWLDLGFANHVPDTKPPPIPKVVSIVYDEEEDVSTICGATYYGPRLSLRNRSDLPSCNHEENRDEKQFPEMHGHHLELELEKSRPQATRIASRSCRSRTSSYMDMDDASLESIMGPRSCRSVASSRPPSASLLQQQQKEQYQRFVDSFTRSFNQSEEQKESFEEDDGSSYASVQRRLSVYLKRQEGLDTTVNLHKTTSMPPAAWGSHTNSSMSTRTLSTLHTQDKMCRATNVWGRRMRSVEV